MKYKVIIGKGGLWDTTVIDPGKHKCNEIIQTIGSFGEIKSTKDKKDDVPVKNNIHISGRS